MVLPGIRLVLSLSGLQFMHNCMFKENRWVLWEWDVSIALLIDLIRMLFWASDVLKGNKCLYCGPWTYTGLVDLDGERPCLTSGISHSDPGVCLTPPRDQHNGHRQFSSQSCNYFLFSFPGPMNLFWSFFVFYRCLFMYVSIIKSYQNISAMNSKQIYISFASHAKPKNDNSHLKYPFVKCP